MTRFVVPLTILASVTVDADTLEEGVQAARRICENQMPDQFFIDGWNSASEWKGAQIVTVQGFDTESVDDDEVEEIEPEKCSNCGETRDAVGGSTHQQWQCSCCAAWNDKEPGK